MMVLLVASAVCMGSGAGRAGMEGQGWGDRWGWGGLRRFVWGGGG